MKEKFNQSDIENKIVKIEMKLKLGDIRLLSKYLEDELIIGLKNVLNQLEVENTDINEEDFEKNELLELYTRVYDIFNEMAEIVYRGMIEKEKGIIDALKQQGIPVEGVVEILAKTQEDEQRISNIYEAVDELEYEKNEAEILKENLPLITKNIIEKLDSDISSLYMPLVIKFISFLSSTTRTFNKSINEAIFSERALEELLNLDLDALDIFLTKLSRVKVKIGKLEGFIIEDFVIYNNSTIIVYYPIFITNPDKLEKIFDPKVVEDIEVTFEP